MYRDRFKISINHGDESLVAYALVLMMFFVTYMSSLSILVISSRMALQAITSGFTRVHPVSGQ